MPGDFAVHPDKVVKYLLNPFHPQGSSKAKFFLGHGFSIRRADELISALLAHTAHPCRVLVMENGLKMIFTGPLPTPNGTRPVVRTVWKREHGSPTTRFLTAYPG